MPKLISVNKLIACFIILAIPLTGNPSSAAMPGIPGITPRYNKQNVHKLHAIMDTVIFHKELLYPGMGTDNAISGIFTLMAIKYSEAALGIITAQQAEKEVTTVIAGSKNPPTAFEIDQARKLTENYLESGHMQKLLEHFENITPNNLAAYRKLLQQ